MRGLILIAAVLSLPAGAVAAPALLPGDAKSNAWRSAECRDPILNRANRTEGRVAPRKLGDLPTGSLYLSVVRHVNGCPEPMVVRFGYDTGGKAQQ